MKEDSRRNTALNILANTGMSRSNYEPYWLRLLWIIGLNVPPPHFASFWITAGITGIIFGVLWSVVMWITVWLSEGKTIRQVALAAIIMGTCFGIANASYYIYSRQKHKLPTWNEINASSHGSKQ